MRYGLKFGQAVQLLVIASYLYNPTPSPCYLTPDPIGRDLFNAEDPIRSGLKFMFFIFLSYNIPLLLSITI